jgi:anti-anti-sigma regulatory factor
MFDAALASGYSFVAVDMSALSFINSTGVAAIENAARRLAARGGRLSIYHARPPIQRVLEITGLSRFCRLDEIDPEQNPEVDLGGITTDLAASAAEIPELDLENQLASIISSHDDVIDGLLKMVIEMANATVVGADGVSVSLRRAGRLSTVAATDTTIMDMDSYQYSTEQGPCVDASLAGQRFYCTSIDTEDRWPSFVPKASSLGIKSILSSPLLESGSPVGALNIYSRTDGAFDDSDQELASLFASEASKSLTAAGIEPIREQQSERIHAALRHRHVVAQAQGVIMERRGVSELAAYTMLRTYSQQTGQPLQRRAEEIVGSTQRSRPVFGPEQSTPGYD